MNEQNIKDIKEKIIRKKIKEDSEALVNTVYVPEIRTTNSIITEFPFRGYVDSNIMRQYIGIARKRKNDKYNFETGEILALLDAQLL